MKKNQKTILLLQLAVLWLCLHGGTAVAQHYLPYPNSLTEHATHFTAGSWKPLYEGTTNDEQAILQEAAAALPHARAGEAMSLRLKIVHDTDRKAEGYVLNINKEGVSVEANTAAGLYYGLQTLRQHIDDRGRLQAVRIEDAPRFAWRGLMLDVSRHFFDKEFVKKQIVLMARYKLNTLHLHLTDAAGWRIEVPGYPRLTEMGAWRTDSVWKTWWNADRRYSTAEKGYGGYYTEADIREMVDFARRHFVTIVPEIEMPAHSEAALTAYPEYSCTHEPYKQADYCPGNEATFSFLEDVLRYVMQVFPSPYIHIGGDEAGMASWGKCARCKARMQEEGLTDKKQLQGYLVRRINRYLSAHGRTLIGWDEILADSLPQEVCAMVWRNKDIAHTAFARGQRVVMTPGAYCYLDSYQDNPATQAEAIGGYLPLAKVYDYDPDPEHTSLVLGVQGNLWTEYVPTPEHAEQMLWPRALAIAETGWTENRLKDSVRFRKAALQATDALMREGYHPFDLRHEYGSRKESRHDINHKARTAEAIYDPDATYSKAYPGSGAATLHDGKRGDWTYTDGRWQGFIGKGMDVTLRLPKSKRIRSVSATFLQSCGPEIYLPASVRISVSNDGKTFVPLYDTKHEIALGSEVVFRTFGWKGRAKARYIRFEARPGKYGGWIFTDEIVVK